LINPSPESRSISDITNLIDKVRPESHTIVWQPWEESDSRFEEYLKHDYKETSNHPSNIFEFENILLKHNIKCYLLVGSDYSNAYSNIKTNPIKNFEVLFWPTALLHYTYYGMINFYGSKPSELFSQYRPIDKLYLNLNNHDRYHRGMLMDMLCKFDLFKDGINTWNNENYSFDFRYFKPQKLSFDNLSFNNPQKVNGVLCIKSQLSYIFLQVKINSDLALVKAIEILLFEEEAKNPGTVFDHDFIKTWVPSFLNLYKLLSVDCSTS
jgi:hypothetical protein